VSQENIDLLRKLYERWERGDFATAEFFDPEVESARIGIGDLFGEWRGIDQMSSATVEYLKAWEDLRIKAERLIDLGDGRVLVLELQSARGRSSSVMVEHELGGLFTLRDGKIVRFVDYWDRAEAMRAAGLEP